MEASVSLITFDSQSIDTIRDHVPAGTCAELAPSEFQPRASTPLLDAVGQGVAMLDKRKSVDERCILAVMTDGYENASREYTKESVRALLDRKQKEEGWLVLYLGAGHDAWAQAGALGLHAGNVASFDKSSVAEGMAAIGTRARRYAWQRSPKRPRQAASPTASAPACAPRAGSTDTAHARSKHSGPHRGARISSRAGLPATSFACSR